MNCQTIKFKIMYATIITNDALNELVKIHGIGDEKLKQKIYDYINQELGSCGVKEDCGSTVKDILVNSGYRMDEVYKEIFKKEPTQEGVEFLSSLYFLGSGDCPVCGLELNNEYYGDDLNEKVKKTCSCGYTTTTKL